MPSEAEFNLLKQEHGRLRLQFDTLARNFNDVWPPRNKATSSDSGTNFELVAITTDGGTGGDESTPCDYTYGFTTSDTTVHSAVSPSQNRLPQALAATYGLWDIDNEILIALDEWPDGGGC